MNFFYRILGCSERYQRYQLKCRFLFFLPFFIALLLIAFGVWVGVQFLVGEFNGRAQHASLRDAYREGLRECVDLASVFDLALRVDPHAGLTVEDGARSEVKASGVISIRGSYGSFRIRKDEMGMCSLGVTALDVRFPETDLYGSDTLSREVCGLVRGELMLSLLDLKYILGDDAIVTRCAPVRGGGLVALARDASFNVSATYYLDLIDANSIGIVAREYTHTSGLSMMVVNRSFRREGKSLYPGSIEILRDGKRFAELNVKSYIDERYRDQYGVEAYALD